MEKINKGFTLWARQTIDSEIFFYKPAMWFKIWFYLVNAVNHTDNKLFKRGEGLITYADIIAKTKATPTQVQKCLDFLQRDYMIDQRRTVRGNIKIVLNYATFQDVGSYKKRGETNGKTISGLSPDYLEALPINKNDKNDKNVNLCGVPPQDITAVIKSFEVVNPSVANLYNNKTQRSATERLIEKYGKNKVLEMVAVLPKLNADRFSKGKSITPMEFENNLGHIAAYFKSNKLDKENKKPSYTKIS